MKKSADKIHGLEVISNNRVNSYSNYNNIYSLLIYK